MAQKAKYLDICSQLIKDIRNGTPGPGEQLATERELAARFGVHRMTVREATEVLARRGFVEKRLPKGIFVRRAGPLADSLKCLHLICAAAASPQSSLFLEYGAILAARHGLHPRPLIVAPGDEHLAVDAMISGDPSIVFNVETKLHGEICQALIRAQGRAVALGVRLEHLGVPCVVGDDYAGIRMAVEHLHALGHRRIGLVCSRAQPDLPLMEVQIQYFRNALFNLRDDGENATADDVDAPIIRLKPTPIGGVLIGAYESAKRYFKTTTKPATALVALDEVVADGVAAACYHAGYQIPGDVSLLAYAGTYYSAMATPPRTSVVISMKDHIELALQLIESGENERLPPEHLLRIVKPTLKRRDSVAQPAPG